MVKKFPLYKILLPLFLLSAPAALGADAPLHFIGQYNFDWGDIPLGRLALSIDDEGEKYTVHLQVASAGIVNLFTRHSSDTTVTGTIVNGVYHPRVYESHYKTKNKPRHIKLVFNEHDVITEETVEPPEDPTERPVVPHKLKDGSLDPLSGTMMLRTGATTVRAFDAKRLYDVKSAAQPKTALRLVFATYPVQPYILSRTPLAGLTAKEQQDYTKGEPPLLFYFSDDARRVPVAVRMPLFVGRVFGVLVKECKTWDECRVN